MRLHYRLGCVLALSLVRALLGFRARGAERVPAQGPVIVASNHVSGWDPILVGLAVRREVHFLAKEELFRNPFLRWLITAFNALPVRRGGLDRQALRASLAVLDGGGVVVLFPEGTRSASGEPREPKGGVGFLASRAGATIVPAYVAGSGALGNAFLRRRPVEVAFGNALAPDKGDSREAYRATAERTMEEVRRLKAEVERR